MDLIERIVKRAVRMIPELTIQIYTFQLGSEALVQIAGDVTLIAINLGKDEDDIENIVQNITLNWKAKTIERYSHPLVYRHFFN